VLRVGILPTDIQARGRFMPQEMAREWIHNKRTPC
jgi:hypothetical protein